MPSLTTIADHLRLLASWIGVTFEQFTGSETADQLKFNSSSIPMSQIASFDESLLNTIREDFGDSLKLVCRQADFQSFNIQDDDWASSLLSMKADRISRTTEFELTVDKDLLLSSVFAGSLTSSQCGTIFFTLEAFNTFLENCSFDFNMLERSIWKNCFNKKAIIFVCDARIFATGKHFAIVSDTDSHLHDVLGAPPKSSLERVEAIAKQAKDSNRWESNWIDFITPSHLDCNFVEPSPNVQQALSAVAANLSLLFSADRVTIREPGFLATYSSENFLTAVESAHPGKERDLKSINTFVRLVEWSLEDKWQSDRAKLVKVSIGRALASDTPSHVFDELLSRIERISSDVHWRWTSLLEGKVKNYLDEEIDLEKEVASTVDSFENQVSLMIGALSTTVLAAVGVFIGSVMVALFKEPFNASIFRMGLLTYIVYLIIFPGVYSMLHHWMRMASATEIFASRRNRFERLIGPDKCSSIVGEKINKSIQRFWTWYWCTVAALVVVVVAVAAACVFVPSMFPQKTDSLIKQDPFPITHPHR